MQQLTITQIRSLTGSLSDAVFFTIDPNQEGIWNYNPDDTTSIDNTGTVLVTSDGKRIIRLVEGFVNVNWFGAKGDGITDDTFIFQTAIDFCLAESIGVVYAKKASYRINGQLNIPIDVCIEGEGTKLLFISSPNNQSAILITQPIGTIGEFKDVLRNISLFGIENNVGNITGDNYKRSDALEIETPFASFKNVYIQGFDKTTVFKSNAYITSFDRCTFRFNNYGLHFDYTSYVNLGENIYFNNCIICNNNYGIYNNMGELVFNCCSIDYNGYQIIENITHLGGINSSRLLLQGCHIEGVINGFINHGIMVISNCAVWHEYQNNNNPYFINEGGDASLTLTNSTFRINNYPYLSIGTPPIIWGASNQEDTAPMRFHRLRSLFPNCDFEEASLDGYMIAYGAAQIVDTKYHSGSRSLRIEGETYANGQLYVEIATLNNVELQFDCYINNYNALNVSYVLITFYNRYKTIIGNTTSVYIPVNSKDVFERVKSDWVKIPINADYARIDLKGDIGIGQYVYWDDLYLTLR